MDDKFMQIAIEQAYKAYKANDIPIGAVIVKDNKIISKAHNQKNKRKVSVYHSEILAIMQASKKLKKWQLDDCTMYVTLKPCKMCMAALAEARIKKVVYLLDSKYNKLEESNFNKIDVIKYENEFEYKKMFFDFFDKMRKS